MGNLMEMNGNTVGANNQGQVLLETILYGVIACSILLLFLKMDRDFTVTRKKNWKKHSELIFQRSLSTGNP